MGNHIDVSGSIFVEMTKVFDPIQNPEFMINI